MQRKADGVELGEENKDERATKTKIFCFLYTGTNFTYEAQPHTQPHHGFAKLLNFLYILLQLC